MWMCLPLLNCTLKIVDVNFICYKKNVDGSLGKLLNSAKMGRWWLRPRALWLLEEIWLSFMVTGRNVLVTIWERILPLPNWVLGKVCWKSSHLNWVGQCCLLYTCASVIIQLFLQCMGQLENWISEYVNVRKLISHRVKAGRQHLLQKKEEVLPMHQWLIFVILYGFKRFPWNLGVHLSITVAPQVFRPLWTGCWIIAITSLTLLLIPNQMHSLWSNQILFPKLQLRFCHSVLPFEKVYTQFSIWGSPPYGSNLPPYLEFPLIFCTWLLEEYAHSPTYFWPLAMLFLPPVHSSLNFIHPSRLSLTVTSYEKTVLKGLNAANKTGVSITYFLPQVNLQIRLPPMLAPWLPPVTEPKQRTQWSPAWIPYPQKRWE